MHDLMIYFDDEEDTDEDIQYFLFSKKCYWATSGERYINYEFRTPYYFIVRNNKFLIGFKCLERHKKDFGNWVFSSHQFRKRFMEKKLDKLSI